VYGADVQDLEAFARRLTVGADQMERIASAVRASLHSIRWNGPDAEEVRRAWDSSYGPRLKSAAQDLRSAAERVRKNAGEQSRASERDGIGGPGFTLAGQPGVPTWITGDVLRHVDDLVMPGAVLLAALEDAKGISVLGGANAVLTGFSLATSAVSMGEHLANHEYVSSGLDAGDMAATGLKATHTPLGYGGGVAVQSLVEAGKAAKDVDWSPKGMQQLRDASLGDWVDGFGYAAQQMPRRLLKIFSL
jgi:hypothetical protein